MYHSREYDDRSNYQSGWRNDGYFQPASHHVDHTLGYQPAGGYQTSAIDDDYFQVARVERSTIRTVDGSPLFYPNNNTVVTETIIREVTPATHRHQLFPGKAQDHVHVKKHVHFERTNAEGNRETYDENIDSEADDFIKEKHKKFNLAKMMSTKAY